MNGIEDLKLMLESRSTDYGKMRQILSMYLLNNDKVVSDIRAKLKVAEDTLKWCLEQANEIGAASLGKIEQDALSMSMAGCVRRCERAIAAIRDEGTKQGGLL